MGLASVVRIPGTVINYWEIHIMHTTAVVGHKLASTWYNTHNNVMTVASVSALNNKVAN